MSSSPNLQVGAVIDVMHAKNGGRLPPPYTAAMRIPIELRDHANGNIALVNTDSGQVLGTTASRKIAEQTRDFFK